MAARDEVKSNGSWSRLKLNPRLVPGRTLASRRVSGYQWCPCYRIAGEGGEGGAGERWQSCCFWERSYGMHTPAVIQNDSPAGQDQCM